jgi:cell division protein ZapA (FtsZ GTPase activity inhibitor)
MKGQNPPLNSKKEGMMQNWISMVGDELKELRKENKELRKERARLRAAILISIEILNKNAEVKIATHT